jgi:dihydrodipicolinate synthase/N-acetylneuraminate lyase
MTTRRYPSGILATCCVPWTDRLEFDEDMFRSLVRSLRTGLTSHLYIFGTAGEGYAVTDRQFAQVCRAFWSETRDGAAEPMVGIISQSLGTVQARIEEGAAIGFRRFQISLPSWGRLDDRELDRFFELTCGRYPGCQFLHYNLGRAGRILTPGEYGRIASDHPNLVATKNSSEDVGYLSRLVEATPDLTHFLTEDGFAYVSGFAECGLLISLASTNFARARRFFETARTRGAALSAMQRELREMARLLDGAIAGEAHMDGASDKIFCRLHLPDFPLGLLPPYSGVSEEVCSRFVAALRESLPAWVPDAEKNFSETRKNA